MSQVTIGTVAKQVTELEKTVNEIDKTLIGHIEGESACRNKVEALGETIWGEGGVVKTVGKIETNVAVILERVSTNRWIMQISIGAACVLIGGILGTLATVIITKNLGT